MDWSRLESQTDSELMAAVQAGDAALMGTLFESHHAALFRYLYSLTRNQGLSEDLTQEVFMRALKYASTYKADFGFRPWLYGMARNAAHDARHKVRGEVNVTDNLHEFACGGMAADESMVRRQHARFLREALSLLPVDKREVLELSRFQDMPHSQIAAVVGCETGAVKVRIHRALKALREKFLELTESEMQ